MIILTKIVVGLIISLLDKPRFTIKKVVNNAREFYESRNINHLFLHYRYSKANKNVKIFNMKDIMLQEDNNYMPN